ncbi:MAG: insulinase family protein [Bacteroidales bacterium]
MKIRKKVMTLIMSIFMLVFSQVTSSAQVSKGLQDNGESGASEKEYEYKTVEGDPLDTRIYTLDNGLKVYMTVFKDKPKVQTYIAVRAGSKHDPPETTGLAHYFEHIMFKGTENIGTLDYEKEAPLIEEIERLFEIYRKTDDEEKRDELYSIIDSLSYEASKYAIPNEYDKIMSTLGASGTNAFTSLEQTVYVNSVPANQLENYFAVEAERIENVVLRGFHTELETIYEEKNMTMTSDDRKMYTALLEGLFQNHTYGTQSTIGSQDHIKNPSMKNIRWFHENYYVPNNMAIALSGDFNPDEAIRIIDDKFGHLEKKPVPEFSYQEEQPVEEPVKKEVMGPDAEKIRLGFRVDGAGTKEADLLRMMSMLLNNGEVGLIDLNLNQDQKVRNASASPMVLADYSVLMLTAEPREDQTLDEVKELLLEQIEKVKQGEFEDWLMEAIVNNLKIQAEKRYLSNNARAMQYVQSFIKGVPWQEEVNKYKRMEDFTKEDIMKFARENFQDNYVAVYKRTGVDESIEKIKKTRITPIEMNRDKKSEYFRQIEEKQVEPIQPEFLDYDEVIQKKELTDGVKILYTPNEINSTFDLYYVFEMGRNHNKKLPLAVDYLEYLGTEEMSATQVKQELFKLGASYSVNTGAEQVYVKLSGLSENMEPAMRLFEDLINNAKPNPGALKEMVNDILKEREDAKKNMQNVFGHLVNFGIYGKDNPATNILKEKELKKLNGEELTELLRDLKNYEHKVLYYGDKSLEELSQLVAQHHEIGEELRKMEEKEFEQEDTDKNIVYYVDFDTPQSMILMISKSQKYNPDLIPTIRLYNSYFGQGMKSLIFQEMRERRSLAYTAMSSYQNPDEPDKHHTNLAFIATQYDKIDDAIGGLSELQNDMMKEEELFELAKESIIKEMRTERITQSSVLFNYLSAQKLDRDYDIRKDIFNEVPELTFKDIKQFQDNYISNQPRRIMIIGKKDELDKKMLKQYGKVKEMKMKEIFGY